MRLLLYRLFLITFANSNYTFGFVPLQLLRFSFVFYQALSSGHPDHDTHPHTHHEKARDPVITTINMAQSCRNMTVEPTLNCKYPDNGKKYSK